MHICFVDESGTPQKPGKTGSEFFVLAGLIVPEERWHRLSDQLHGLKVRRQYHGELKWRYFAPSNDKDDNPMRDWTQARRDQLRNEVFNVLTSDRSLKIIAGVSEATPAYAMNRVRTQNDLYFMTYKVLTERFQYFLQDVSRTSGRRTLGIIVADHRGKGDDARMRTQHQRLVENVSAFTATYTNLIEGLFLAPSHLSVGIQLVDMVAGAIWRRFGANDATWFDKLRPVMRQSSAGVVDGYGIARFPKTTWTGPVP